LKEKMTNNQRETVELRGCDRCGSFLCRCNDEQIVQELADQQSGFAKYLEQLLIQIRMFRKKRKPKDN
jgi:hypothetical protein